MDASDPIAPRRHVPPRGCGIAAVVSVGLAVAAGVVAWTWHRRAETEALEAQAVAAEQAFEPVFEKMEEAGGPYDLDRTIRVIHETDRMLKDTESLPEYLSWASRQDYRGVAPDVLAARKDVLEVVMRLYARQVRQRDQEELSRFSAESLLQVASLVSVEGEAGVGISGSFSLDREQARKLLAQAIAERAERKRLLADLRTTEDDLLAALVRYAGIYAGYVEAWDRLCLLRDRAYLAAAAEDWPTVAAAAAEAIRQAPQEREAHLLLALALVEGGPEILPEVDAGELLDTYLLEHPDATAPALLLLGLHHAREGDVAQAQLALMQAAAYYPRQAEALADLFDPYEARSYLRATREGRYVLEQYQSTMLGAGRFSPDLQLARLAFRAGDTTTGRRKLMEHFYRRRAQKEWSFILDDVRFCQREFGADFRTIFPPESYLDLIVEPSMLGLSDNLSLSVRNRSDVTLHNATLLLCIHFTDMYPDDYEVLVGGETRPAVNAHEKTSFGEISVEREVLGRVRTRDDVVRTRAILVADEAVTWVDTEEYRVAEAREFRQAPAPLDPSVAPGRAAPALLEALRQGTGLAVEESRIGRDDVVVRLPRELVLLSPLFRLQVGDRIQAPRLDELDLQDGAIRLRFDGVLDRSDRGDRPALTLLARTPWGREVRFRWTPDGSGGYGRVTVEEGPASSPVPAP